MKDIQFKQHFVVVYRHLTFKVIIKYQSIFLVHFTMLVPIYKVDEGNVDTSSSLEPFN